MVVTGSERQVSRVPVVRNLLLGGSEGPSRGDN